MPERANLVRRKSDEGFVSPAFGRAVVGHSRRLVYADGTAMMYGHSDRTDFLYPETGEDSGVEMLYVFDKEKKPMGVLVNVACPSQVMEAMCKMSSDYWGKVRDLAHANYGEDFTVVGLCGAAGCFDELTILSLISSGFLSRLCVLRLRANKRKIREVRKR